MAVVIYVEALHGMEAVAEHINEMQKIYEEYGGIFEELMRHQKQGHACNKVDSHLWLHYVGY